MSQLEPYVEIAARSLLALAFLLALLLVLRRRAPEARPLVLLLGAELGIDLARLALRLLVLAPARAAGRVPYEGVTRALFHLDQALLVGWSALALAFASTAFLKPAGRLLAPAWALVTLALALAYPALRGDPLVQAYRGIHAAATVAALFALVSYLVRRRGFGRVQLAAVLLLAGDVAAFFGPWLRAVVTDWPLAHLQNALVYLLVSGLLVWWTKATWATTATSSPESCSQSPPSPSSRR